MRPDPRLRGLYAITRGNYRDTDELLREVGGALRGGCRIVQYRDKSTDQKLRLEQASALAVLCHRHDAVLIVNDDIDLAVTCDADGVHLGRDDADIIEAVTKLGAGAIVGVSCYNQLDTARRAAAGGASYVAFGSFFPSPTKPKAVRASPRLLYQWEGMRTPVCAIGGITIRNAAKLVHAGADMTAVISDLWTAPDIEARARQYQRLWEE